MSIYFNQYHNFRYHPRLKHVRNVLRIISNLFEFSPCPGAAPCTPSQAVQLHVAPSQMIYPLPAPSLFLIVSVSLCVNPCKCPAVRMPDHVPCRCPGFTTNMSLIHIIHTTQAIARAENFDVPPPPSTVVDTLQHYN